MRYICPLHPFFVHGFVYGVVISGHLRFEPPARDAGVTGDVRYSTTGPGWLPVGASDSCLRRRPWRNAVGVSRRFSGWTCAGVGLAAAVGRSLGIRRQCPRSPDTVSVVQWIPDQKEGFDEGIAVGQVAARCLL